MLKPNRNMRVMPQVKPTTELRDRMKVLKSKIERVSQ